MRKTMLMNVLSNVILTRFILMVNLFKCVDFRFSELNDTNNDIYDDKHSRSKLNKIWFY